ncbi:Uu.00g018990.m01.CDS01 [Anthostomella pinea]|uniref:Uu.00g018990.m01.CDS01 n=1 Tax=Anthostomella pinea TaxID=933095 RepID=A0AAI8VZR9_9PEZI|nr:Uu.00g018990.m01.CDS01 [Anthostomella pinea]
MVTIRAGESLKSAARKREEKIMDNINSLTIDEFKIYTCQEAQRNPRLSIGLHATSRLKLAGYFDAVDFDQCVQGAVGILNQHPVGKLAGLLPHEAVAAVGLLLERNLNKILVDVDVCSSYEIKEQAFKAVLDITEGYLRSKTELARPYQTRRILADALQWAIDQIQPEEQLQLAAGPHGFGDDAVSTWCIQSLMHMTQLAERHNCIMVMRTLRGILDNLEDLAANGYHEHEYEEDDSEDDNDDGAEADADMHVEDDSEDEDQDNNADADANVDMHADDDMREGTASSDAQLDAYYSSVIHADDDGADMHASASLVADAEFNASLKAYFRGPGITADDHDDAEVDESQFIPGLLRTQQARQARLARLVQQVQQVQEAQQVQQPGPGHCWVA